MTGKAYRMARRALDRERHRKAAGHEIRIDILTYFVNHGTGSPSAIAKEIGVPVQSVDRHMKQLVRYGGAELVEIRPTAAGPPQHVYRAITRPMLDEEDVAELSLPARHGFARQCIEAIIDDIADAAEAGLFAKRTDWVLTRTPVLLDTEGAEELQALHERLVEETLQVRARSDARRSKSGEPARRVSSCQLYFLLPESTDE